MPTIRQIAEPQASILTPVPPAGPGICAICHGIPNPGYDTCYSCEQAMSQVTKPCTTVVPFSLYETGHQLWSVLRKYKDSPDPKVRDRFSTQVAAFLGMALIEHRGCLEETVGEWDLITTVPSTSGKRTGPHPLVGALSRIDYLRREHKELLAPGPVALGHNKADDEGFITVLPVTGKRVLLVDDTYTSGARVQSAASCLQLAGATVPAIVVVGRVITPGWGPHVAEFWKEQRRQRFDFDTCALEQPEPEVREEDEEDEGWWDYEPGEPPDWYDEDHDGDWEPF